jgi:stage IV sporulation protein FB
VFGEPQRTQYDLNFSLFGIPVRVDPWFWLVTLMLGSKAGDAGAVLTWIIAVFLSVLIHELGHALAMLAYGFRPWITLYGLGGQTAYNPGYSEQSGRGSGPLGQILISSAGPGAGFLLAAALVLVITVAGHGDGIVYVGFGQWKFLPQVLLPNMRVAELLNDIFFISIFWGFINLLPIYPLDGGQITREVLLVFNSREGIRQSLLLSIIAAGLMAIAALVHWHSLFTTIFFGYLAYANYAVLQAYSGQRPW